MSKTSLLTWCVSTCTKHRHNSTISPRVTINDLLTSLHKHKITNLQKFELNNLSSKWRDNYERKNTTVTWRCVLSDAWFRDLKIYSLSTKKGPRRRGRTKQKKWLILIWSYSGTLWIGLRNLTIKGSGHYLYCQRPVFSLGVS